MAELYGHAHPLEDFIPDWSCGAFYYAGTMTPPSGEGFRDEPIGIDLTYIRREDCPEHGLGHIAVG
jgi:hypothetical protein